jgi:von Willebrand factor type A domain
MRRPPAIDTYDAAAFRRPSLRTRLVRAVLATAAIASVAAAAASARGDDVRVQSVLPTGSTGIVVLDLSLSIQDKDYRRLRGALRHLIAVDAPVGLVVFSDAPYELLPPGTPARELQNIIRLLIPPQQGQPVNPWSEAFRGGTRISSALAMASHMLERDQVQNGSVLLISDLETAPEDVQALLQTLRDLRARSVPVKIVTLSAGRESTASVKAVAGAEAFAPPSAFTGDPGERRAVSGGGVLPQSLIALGALCLALLGAHERFAGRLGLPRLEGRVT